MSIENTQTLPYELEFDENALQLYGTVLEQVEGTKYKVISGFHLQNHLQELNYHEFLISPANLNNFLKKLKDKKPGRYLLGERRDAKVEVTISGDRLSATLKITKAWGGKKMNNAKIIEAIRSAGISQERILVEELKKIAENHHDDIELLFAKGKLPVRGQDAEIKMLLESRNMVEQDTESQSAIDQREVYEFVVVDPGQALLEKKPATAGKAGMDVTGKVIPPQAAKDLNFNQPFEGVEISPANENVLIATIKGHPVFTANGAKVDPVLHVENVNIKSGNIDYDGSVFVKNNVESGFIVKASGDIHVKGQVEKSNLIAKGNITVGGGILGEEEEGKLKARLSSDGDVHARFINLAFVRCGGNLHVDEYIMQSRISAKGNILVGQEKGKGRIIGGFISSEASVRAKILGSDAYVATNIVLGAEHNENRDLNRLHAEQERRTFEISQLRLIEEKINSNKSKTLLGNVQLNKENKIHNTITALENQLKNIELEIQEHEKAKHEADAFKVHASGIIYPNVSINICGKAWHCDQELRGQTFCLDKNRVTHDTYEA